MTTDWTPGQPGRPAVDRRGRRRPAVNAGRLWAGGAATAVVAALIAIVGILIARGIFSIPVLAPKGSGTWGNANTVTYALVAFGCGLLATAIIHVLLLSTPSPFAFFGWIIGLCTLLATLAPFVAGGDMAPKAATAIINALIGIGIWTLTVSTGRRSVQ